MKILIVDDNDINRQFLCGVLSDSHKITEAKDGIEAISHCQTEQFEIILMDIRMPGIDGREATQQIRQLERYHDTPIIALTADLHLQQSNDLTDQGFTLCLSKPVSRNSLLKALDQLDQTQQQTHHEPTKESPNEMPVNWTKALAAAGGNESLVNKLCTMLARELDDYLPRIKAHIDLNEYDLAKELSHKLQGSAGFCSAGPLQNSARNLEKVLVAADINSLMSALERLQSAANTFQQYLKT